MCIRDRKATHTWLAGKIKCGNCGYALMSIYNPSGKQYLRCTKRLDNKRDVYKRQAVLVLAFRILILPIRENPGNVKVML